MNKALSLLLIIYSTIYLIYNELHIKSGNVAFETCLQVSWIIKRTTYIYTNAYNVMNILNIQK